MYSRLAEILGPEIYKGGRLVPTAEAFKPLYLPTTGGRTLNDSGDASEGDAFPNPASRKGKSTHPPLIAIYFSAHWCPPCRNFTPLLSTYYRSMYGGDGNVERPFEVVFVSRDRSAPEFLSYYATMPWLAVPYESAGLRDRMCTLFGVSGIPKLVLLDGSSLSAIDMDAVQLVRSDRLRQKYPGLGVPMDGRALNATTATGGGNPFRTSGGNSYTSGSLATPKAICIGEQCLMLPPVKSLIEKMESKMTLLEDQKLTLETKWGLLKDKMGVLRGVIGTKRGLLIQLEAQTDPNSPLPSPKGEGVPLSTSQLRDEIAQLSSDESELCHKVVQYETEISQIDTHLGSVKEELGHLKSQYGWLGPLVELYIVLRKVDFDIGFSVFSKVMKNVYDETDLKYYRVKRKPMVTKTGDARWVTLLEICGWTSDGEHLFADRSHPSIKAFAEWYNKAT